MRSELVSAAIKHTPNRYSLSRVVSRATRGLHRPNTRIEDTLNEAFRLLSGTATVEAAAACSDRPAAEVDQDALLYAD